MESRGLIVASVWVCVTILSVVIIWVSKQLDLWTALFILLLFGGAFVITFGTSYRDFMGKQPATRVEGKIEEISKQLEELRMTVDYIKKQLEE